ncbi:hypothetical protein AYK24_03355 [Thermoplasmatales archaeon SG8-52-4]|nr:MAG: hypothetical protein AYK24_03355 [Thermoplasmatales archaeon SG8-52-4]
METFDKNKSGDEIIYVKEIFQRLLKVWYWGVLFGLIGLTVAFFVNKILTPTYEISAELYAPDKNNGMGVENIFDVTGIVPRMNIQNHIGILSSYSITRQSLENLDWRVTWFEKDVFGKKDLYKYAPLRIENFNPLLNLPGIYVNVTPNGNDYCIISANDKLRMGGTEKDIQFETKYKYGDTLRNEFFSFVLNKNSGRSIDQEKKYIFVFNDFNKLARDYQRKLDISLVDPEAEIIKLKIVGNHPEREVDFLNEICDVFIKFGLNAKNRTSENTVNFIDSQLSGIVDSLQSAGRSFTNFRSRNRTIDLSQQAGLVVERLQELESEESLAKMELEYYQNLSTYLGDADRMEQVVAPSVVGVTDPVLNAMVVKLSELYSKKSTLTFSVQEKNPSLLALENEIQYTRHTLEENLKNLINNAQFQLNSLQQRKNQISSQLAQLPKTEQDLINIKRQFDLNNELYTYLLQKRAEAAITKASNVPDAQILDAARIETVIPLGPNKMLNYILGLIMGLGIPGIIMALLFHLDNTVKSKEDIIQVTSIPIIGTVGHSKRKEELPVLTEPHSGVSESFRSLRTNLEYLGKLEGNKVIAIHSNIDGEGKTFTAINLAISMAQNNKKVLLINADLRKPKINSIFKINNDYTGLSSYLINKSKIEDIAINSKIKNLTIIPSGPIPPNPAELLDNGNFEKLIHKAKEHFDCIVVDDSPASFVTDAVIVGKYADINLFVIRAEITNRDHIKMINYFRDLGTMKNLAIILNDAQSSLYGYSNYNSKGYGVYAEKKSKKNKELPVEEALSS